MLFRSSRMLVMPPPGGTTPQQFGDGGIRHATPVTSYFTRCTAEGCTPLTGPNTPAHPRIEQLFVVVTSTYVERDDLKPVRDADIIDPRTGTIDDGRELFGGATQLANGQRAGDGYRAKLVDPPGGQRPLCPAQVHDQADERHIGTFGQPFADGFGVGHLRYPLGAHKTRDFDFAQARARVRRIVPDAARAGGGPTMRGTGD